MPEETVELMFGANSSAKFSRSDSAEECATRLAELQEQVGAEQVGSYTELLTQALVICQ